jgi:hypothetical protein
MIFNGTAHKVGFRTPADQNRCERRGTGVIVNELRN